MKELKQCSKCKRNLPATLEFFYGNRLPISIEKYYFKNPCKECTRSDTNKYNLANLDATPGDFLSLLHSKAEEAGCQILVLNTRKHKPSQTCPLSDEVVKKPLRQRTHTLPNGRVIGRDQAAALSMLVAGLRLLGREPAWARQTAPETATQSREAA